MTTTTQTTPRKAHLALADGTIFTGISVGAEGETTGEAVFTTGMTGYQEVLTDPSYCGQIVTMTAPQIGNTGINDEDPETDRPYLAGFIMRELSPVVSNWRSNRSLHDYLVQHGIVGLANIDTRALTRHIRDNGAQTGVIGTGDPAALVQKAKAAPSMDGLDLTGTSPRPRATSGPSRARPGPRRPPATVTTWWPWTSASSATSCAAWWTRAARSPWSPRAPRRQTSWP
jgi:carbamoyl-phosphate synthase small subunit